MNDDKLLRERIAQLERDLAKARALLAGVTSVAEEYHGTDGWRHNVCSVCDRIEAARALLRRDEARVAWENAEGTVVRSPGTFSVAKAHEHAMAVGGWVERDEARRCAFCGTVGTECPPECKPGPPRDEARGAPECIECGGLGYEPNHADWCKNARAAPTKSSAPPDGEK